MMEAQTSGWWKFKMAALRRVEILFKKTLKITDNLYFPITNRTYARRLHCSTQTATMFSKDTGKKYRVNLKQKNETNLEPEPLKLQLSEEELMQYPIKRFTGSIHIIKEPSHEHDLAILNVLNKLKQETVLGLDVEMTESGQENEYNKRRKKRTRVVQIASETDAIVWQLKNFASLPSSLVLFLTSDILKVGHAVSDDVVLLKKEFNVTSRRLFDTLPWAIQLNCKPLGLHALCAIFLGWRISKGLRTSDWNRSKLSENQIHYACTDAWASLVVYKEMKRVASDNGCTLPLPIESVTYILDTRLDSRRKRRHRLVQNYKARKNFAIMARIAERTVE